VYLCVEVWNSWIYMTSEAGKGRGSKKRILFCVLAPCYFALIYLSRARCSRGASKRCRVTYSIPLTIIYITN